MSHTHLHLHSFYFHSFDHKIDSNGGTLSRREQPLDNARLRYNEIIIEDHQTCRTAAHLIGNDYTHTPE